MAVALRTGHGPTVTPSLYSHPSSGHRFNRSLPKQAKAKSILSSLQCAADVFAQPLCPFW